MQPLLHALAVADVARDAQDLLRLLAGCVFHQPHGRLEPDVMLVDVPRAIDDRRQRFRLRGLGKCRANDVEVFGVNKFAQ